MNKVPDSRIGLLGIILLCVTMAGMPLADPQFLNLSPALATFVRGLSGLVVVPLLTYTSLEWPNSKTVFQTMLFVLATFCLFEGLRVWGAIYTAVFLDFAFVVPMTFTLVRSKTLLGFTTFGPLAIAIFGTTLTLRLWGQNTGFSWPGLMWSLGALFTNGLYIVVASRVAPPPSQQRRETQVFSMSVGLVVTGGLMGLQEGFLLPLPVSMDPWQWMVLLLVFSVVTGIGNISAFFYLVAGNLSDVAIGILVLGVTPSIAFSSYLFLGQQLGADQWLGIVLTIVALIGYNLLNQPEES